MSSGCARLKFRSVWVFLACLFSCRCFGADNERLLGGLQQLSLTSGHSSAPELSRDGRYVLFSSSAANLTADPTRPFSVDLYLRDRTVGTNYLVSRNASSESGGNGFSYDYRVTPDGARAVFASEATNLVSGDRNGLPDIFLRTLPDGPTTWVSRPNAVIFSTFRSVWGSINPDISADGRYVAFQSDVALSRQHLTNKIQIYLWDQLASSNILVSLSRNRRAGNNVSTSPQISEDGRYVVYESLANDLLPTSDGNNASDIFLYDTLSNVTSLVSVSLSGGVGDRASTAPVLSRNGRYVAFLSQALNLSTNNGAGSVRLFLRDLEQKTTVRISDPNTVGFRDLAISKNGEAVVFTTRGAAYRWDSQSKILQSLGGGANSEAPGLSEDGSRVAWLSQVASGELYQVCLRDFATGDTVKIVSENFQKTSASSNDCRVPVISGDGAVLACESGDSDLVPGDLNQSSDIFSYDVETSELNLLSVPQTPSPSPDHSVSLLSATPDGSRLLLATSAALVPGDTNAVLDAYIFDTVSRQLLLGSSRDADTNAAGAVWPPALSGNGRFVAFGSLDSALAPNDTNNGVDIFIRDLQQGRTMPVSVSFSSSATANRASTNPVVSEDGRYVAFESAATDLAQSDTNNRTDVFLRDLQTSETVNITGPIGTTVRPVLRAMSPGGRYTLFTFNSLFLFDLAERQAREIATNATAGGSQVFSTDSSRFVFTANGKDIIVYEPLTAATNLVCSGCDLPVISGDGSSVAYRSTNGMIFSYDTASRSHTLISTNAAPQIIPSFTRPQLNHDGTVAVFASRPPRLTQAFARYGQVFAHDERTGSTRTISARNPAQPGNHHSQNALISSNGLLIAFQSLASDLVTEDRNTQTDIFIFRPFGSGMDSDSDGLPDEWELTYFNDLSHDGRADTDLDELTDAEEYRAGTNPSLDGSLLRVEIAESVLDDAVLISWPSIPGKSYLLESRRFIGGDAWRPHSDVNSGAPVAATGDVTTVEDVTAAFPYQLYYRVRLIE